MKHLVLAAIVACMSCAGLASAAGVSLTLQLPEGTKVESATATAAELKLSSPGKLAGQSVVFESLLPATSYTLRLTLADGTVLQGVDMGWHGPEPLQPNAEPMDDEDRKQLQELFDGIKGFENKRRMLHLSGNHDRATVLAELIRDTEFHSDKGGEIIWRVELWYFKNQHGGWEKVQQMSKVLRRERFAGRTEFEKETSKLRWLPALGGIRVDQAEVRKTIRLTPEQLLAR